MDRPFCSSFVALFFLVGCAGEPAPKTAANESAPALNEPNGPSNGSNSAATPTPSTAAGTPLAPASNEPSPAPAPGTPTLPAVTVRNVGLHVGGGPNDAAGKAPFLTAIEQQFPEFLRCYRLVSEPGTGGTFGIDLHIERTGHHPRTEQPRTALGGDPFRECMIKAFEAVDFPRLQKPAVISYSVRFTVGQSGSSPATAQ
jgi:hypothetical protein